MIEEKILTNEREINDQTFFQEGARTRSRKIGHMQNKTDRQVERANQLRSCAVVEREVIVRI